MKITKVVVGLLEENCYVLEKDKQVIVVDPGDEYERIKKVIGRKKVAGVLITHNHFDHVGALEEFDPSLVYKYDNLEEGEHTIGPFNFEVIYTPGHTKDSVSYYFKEDNILFDGDFVFCLGIGRCDLDDGDYKEMMRSIEKIKKYPKHTPFTKESLLYREIFEEFYPGYSDFIVDYWMPNKEWDGCQVDDPSARVLSNYGDSGK